MTSLPSLEPPPWGGSSPKAVAGPPTALVLTLRALLALLIVLGAVALFWTTRHAIAIRRLTRGGGNTVFYSADGRPWFPLDESRRDVPLGEVAKHLRLAVLAVEDHRFYRHPGLDPVGMARAAWLNFRRRAVVQGGSTLTQQLARTVFLGNQRTLGRKLKEAVLAVMLEQQLDKDQILELYLNRIYLSAGTYGVETLSRRLFAKRSRDLTLAEAALVAGLIRAPSALSPWTNIEGAVARSDTVLARMRALGMIEPEQERQARAARLRVTASPGVSSSRFGYAKDFLRQQFREEIGGDDAPDWEVHTTVLPSLQQAAEDAVVRGLDRLGRPGLQAALVALDPQTGDVLAVVGGRDFRASQFNRAVRSRRQPGSAFKPFVYAVGLQKGLSPVSVLTNLHAVMAPGKEEWTPRNVGEAPDEATLRQALLESNNKAAVALQMQVGTGPVRDLSSRLGMKDLPDVPSLALGTGLVTPLELTAAFAVFPNGGLAVAPRGIVKVLDAEGSVVHEMPVRSKRVLSEEAAFQALTMLRDVVDVGTASAARSFGVHGPVGGKTGTTSEFKDAWFVGFTSSVVAGVWVGYDQPEPIGQQAYAARVALPIWADFMRRIPRSRPAEEFSPPPGLREVELCRLSYLRPLDGCPTYVEFLKDGDDVPGRLCPFHQGSLKQEARRLLDGLLGRLARKLRDAMD